MTKMLPAECAGGIVTVGGVPVVVDSMVGQGVAPSSGVVFLDGEKSVYVNLEGTDLKTLIEKLATIVTQVVTVSTILDSATLSPGSAAAAIAQLTASQVELVAMGEMLQ